MHKLDEFQPTLDKIISNHSLFPELKKGIDALKVKRFATKKHLKGTTWTGYASIDSYLCEITPNTKIGKVLADMQKQILQDLGLLGKNDDWTFTRYRIHDLDWDVVRAWAKNNNSNTIAA